jgi:hypothetical protein
VTTELRFRINYVVRKDVFPVNHSNRLNAYGAVAFVYMRS